MTTENLQNASRDKPSGWFSRRHDDDHDHRRAREAYQERHGLEARRETAADRQQKRDQLSPAEQIVALDERLGSGQGARKERARLQALIS